ncbi:hypothetical protein ACXZ65_38030 [Streptomyces aculeolatus]
MSEVVSGAVPSSLTGGWRPLSKRNEPEEPEVLLEDAPPFLAAALQQWAEVIANSALDSVLKSIALRLRLPPARTITPWKSAVLDAMLHHALDVVDALLHFASPSSLAGQYVAVADLNDVLLHAGSAWRVNAERDGLERRVDGTVVQAHQAAREAADEAGYPAATQRLRQAWAKAYGRAPEPGATYRDAVAAVEAVACPLFLSAEQQPTLGKVRAHLDSARHKYEMVILDRDGAAAPIDAVVEMIGLLWHGQRDRHEGGPSTAAITQDAAEQAVHLASVLVQLIASGGIRRKP